MRVMEIQGSASGEDAGRADTRYNVRTEVQDRLLQLASGKIFPAMIDCGTCGGKGSARELNLSIVDVLRYLSLEFFFHHRRLNQGVFYHLL